MRDSSPHSKPSTDDTDVLTIYYGIHDALRELGDDLHDAGDGESLGVEHTISALWDASSALSRLFEQLEVERKEVERLRDFLGRADETFRLIAVEAGADGTNPDDWRALVHKWDFALEAVRDLRIDYDEALGVSSPASEPPWMDRVISRGNSHVPSPDSNQESKP